VAAFIRRTLQIEVDMIHGHYGEFQVVVDGTAVVDGGALAALGVLPSRRTVVDRVRAHLDL
jgi:hypothetical protein